MTKSRRRFGPMPDEVPIVGQGTWQMAEGRHRADEVAALRAGIARGLTHIDTAEMYGSGAAEELIAEAIRDIPRRELFIVSKVLPQNASHARHAARLRAEPAAPRHRPPRRLSVALARQRAARRDAGRAGGTGRPGQDPRARRLELRRLRSGRGARSPAQAPDRLQPGAVSPGRAPHRRRAGRRTARSTTSPSSATARSATAGFRRRRSAGGRALAAVAARHGATPRQVALAFLARKPPLFTIPKASTPAHAEENAGALDLALTAADLAEIDAAFAGPRRQRATGYLGHELVLGSRHRPPTQFAGARQCTVSLHCMPSPAGFGQTPSVFRGISEMP